MDKRKILLIDDEEDMVNMLKPYLEAHGYDVIVSYDGKEALKKIEEKPDLILLDIMMPGMNGLEVLHRLKNNPSTQHVPVIMVTAKGESDYIFKAQDLKATDYIIKPIKLEEMLSLIKRLV